MFNGANMRKLIGLFLIALLAGCGGEINGSPDPVDETGECSNDGQKQFVLDNLYAWYLWNDLLPADLSIANYDSPEQLITDVTREYGPRDPDDNPLDLFSSVGSLQADQEFFGEGKYKGFGFSYRFESSTVARLSRVFSDSPAARATPFPLARGQRILSLNGRTIADINANEGISAALAGDTVEFEMQRVDSSTFTTSITRDVVTIDPIPQWRVIERGAGLPPVGFIELSSFISTANPVFDDVFAAFRQAGVNDVILDLRYNGGGLVSTADLLGDYFGGLVAENLVFSRTEFNADRAAASNSTEFFERLGNSMSLSRLVVVATGGTASASELVTNGMIPHVDVTIVGDNTFGKPVGQIGLAFCDKIMRPTSFRIANADGAGDYFDGLPVDCAAPDDLDFAVGADDDPNMIAAMSVLNTGACPAVATTEGQFAPQFKPTVVKEDRRGPPHRELLDAY